MSKFISALFLLFAQDATLQVKVSLVTVGVRVTDSRGRDVRGLKETAFSLFDDGELQKVARESGGEAFFPTSDKDLAKAVNEIMSDLRTQYTLAFYPQSDDAHYHQLRVAVRGGRYEIRARPGYGMEP